MDARFLRVLFLAALLLRLAFVWQIRDLPTQRWLVMDAQHYDALAREIAAGGWMPREVFYQAPLYPYFLAVVYTVSKGSLLAVRLLQAVLGAVTVVLLAVLARRLFGRGAGRAAGVLAALYGPAIFYVPLLLKPTLMLLALTGAVLLLVGPHPLTPSPAPSAPLPGRGGKGKGFGWWRPSPGEEGWGGGRGDGGEGLGGRGLRRLLAAGALFGVSALLQEILILLVPCAAVWLLLPRSPSSDTGEAGSRARRLAAVLALALGAGLGLAPATLLNVLAGGEAVLISSAGGVSFFIGNSRGASGTYAGLSSGSHSPESQREDSRRLAAAIATRERGRQVAPEELPLGEVSSLLWRESFREIRADPAAWGRLLLRKARLFWNAYEIPDAEGYDVYRRQAGPLTLLWIGFGVVAPLGLAGLGLAWWGGWRDPQTRRDASLLTLLLAGLFASVVLFFVFGRYRLPAVVLLLPPAGHAVAVLVEAVRRRELRRLARIGGMTCLAAGLVLLPAWSPAERARLDTAIWFNLSTAALRGAAQPSTEPEEALALTSRAADDLARVLEIAPGFYVARVQRAAALYRRGTYLAGTGALEPALASSEEARRELAIAQAVGGGSDLPDAERQARELAAALAAGTAQMLVNLGAQRIEAGDLEQAEAALRRALTFSPLSAPAHGNLGLCLLRQGARAGRAGDAAAAARLRTASHAAFARALELAGPDARRGELAFYQKGLEMAGG